MSRASFRRSFDAWGNLRHSTGTTLAPFAFTGHELDATTGLTYAKARFLDTEVGRFLSEDPILGEATTPPSLHRYLYAYGNPTFYVDPTGRLTVGEWVEAVWDATKQTAKDTVKVAAYGAAGVAAGAAITAGAVAVAAAAPVVAAGAGAAALTYGVYEAAKSGVERWGEGQTVKQAAVGGVADTVGATSLVAGVADVDIATGEKLNLSHEEKIEALQAGAFAVGALYGGVKTSEALDFTTVGEAAGRGFGEGAAKAVDDLAPRFEVPPARSAPTRVQSARIGEGAAGGVDVADVQATRSVPAAMARARGSLPPARPTWQAAQASPADDLSGFGFESEPSYVGGIRVRYGTKGSVRPDYASERMRLSADVKRYDVNTAQGRWRLEKDIVSQVGDRARNLPEGMRQGLVIDIRGQQLSDKLLQRMINRIEEKSNGLIQSDNIVVRR